MDALGWLYDWIFATEQRGQGDTGSRIRRSRVIGRFPILGLSMLLLIACGGLSLPPLGSDQQRFQQRIDDVTITLDSSKTPQVDQTETLRITLHDAQGRPISDAVVSVDLEMDMLCLSGMTPVGNPSGGGSYEVHTVYQMAGEWRVTVLVELGQQRHRAVFAVNVAA
jgi:hypothetical protein